MVWKYLGCILLRSLKVIPSGPAAGHLLISLTFLEMSLAAIMVQKVLFSAWPISCNSPRPLTIPCDSHLDLNTEFTSSDDISHFMDSISSRMIPPNFPHPSRIAAGVVTIASFWQPSSSTQSIYYTKSYFAFYKDLEKINYYYRVFLMFFFHVILYRPIPYN